MSDFYTPEQDKAGLESTDDTRAELPSVFLIGDSISGGYTKPVTKLLEGICNVQRAPDNCGDTRRGLEKLDEWLGDRQWDLIHFNWGLHDLCYRHPEATVYGNRDKIKGTISVPLDDYRINLETLVKRLLQRGCKLIWASTTFVPEGEAGRHQGDDVKYNEAAAEIMERHGIPTDDLYALSASFGPEMFTCPGDVHYSDAGKRLLAQQVAACIQEQLGPDLDEA